MPPAPVGPPLGLPTSSQDALRRLEARYDAYLTSGEYEAFLLPWSNIGAIVVIVYLMIDHRKSPLLFALRWPVWLFNTLVALYHIFFVRARNPCVALGNGLVSLWCFSWTSKMLILNDAQRDYRRIERLDRVLGNTTVATDGHAQKESREDPSLHDVHVGEVDSPSPSHADGKHQAAAHTARPVPKYVWQTYPTASMLARLDWVLDAATTSRGVAWNYSITGIAPPPEHVTASLKPPPSPSWPKKPLMKTHADRPAVLRHNLYLLVRCALILDLMKTHISHDPYFWGVMGQPLPSFYPSILTQSPFLTRVFRLLIALTTFRFGLEIVYCLGPLSHMGLIHPDRLGVRGEAWNHPDQFGSLTAVLDKGLAGWWSGWWHQMFKKAFVLLGERAVLALGLRVRSKPGRLVGLFVAFAWSGCLHAAASHTQIGDTRPVRASFVFFVAQAVGISLEMAVKDLIRQTGLQGRLPAWAGKVGNLVYAHWWLYLTAPLLVEDFAKGGLFLFEPVPVSLFRGPLRLGNAEDDFWRWRGGIFRWHAGGTWWRTGIAL